MATIAKLSTKLSLDSGQFVQGMHQSGEAAKGFSMKTAIMGTAIGNVLAHIAEKAVAFGVEFLKSVGEKVVEGVKSAMESIDGLAKSAAKLGVTTEALAGLRLAAKLAGVENDALEKSMQKLVYSANMATTGSKMQAEAFADLGINLQELMRQSPDKMLETMAAGFKNTTDTNVKLNAAMVIFGERNTNMINLLAGGAEAFKKAQENAKAFGLAITGMDSSKVTEANDSLTLLKAAAQGAFYTIATNLSPVITTMSAQFIEWWKSGEGAAKKITTAMDAIVPVIALVATGIQKVILLFAIVNSLARQAISGAADRVAQEAADKFHKLRADGAPKEDIKAAKVAMTAAWVEARDKSRSKNKAVELVDSLQKKDVGDVINEAYAKSKKAAEKTANIAARPVPIAASLPGGGLQQPMAFDAGKNELESFAKGVTESIKTPLQKFIEYKDQVLAAVKSGALSAKDVTPALERKSHLLGLDKEEQPETKEANPKPEAKLNTTASLIRTGSAQSEALRFGGGANSSVATWREQLVQQRKATEYLAALAGRHQSHNTYTMAG